MKSEKGKTMSKLTILVSAALVASGTFAATYTYIGGSPFVTDSWNNDWNDEKDRKITSTYLWSSQAAPTSGNDYAIDNSYSWVQFKAYNGSDRF